MKNKILIITAFACIGLVSCKDYLSTSSPSEFTSDLVFTSPVYTEYAIMGTYALLTQNQLYAQRLPVHYATNTDIEIAGADATTYKDNGVRGLSNYVGNPSNTYIAREWSQMYKLIERANLCIQGIKNSPAIKTADSTVMKRYLGEALTLRALVYSEIIKHWGDVPFKIEPTKYDLSNAYDLPTDRDIIYSRLIEDLQLAETYVPWLYSNGYNTAERITKGFIKGLIARLALYRGGYSIRNKPGFPTERGDNWEYYYELARQKTSEVMSSGIHKLNTNYVDIWKKLCALQLENTFNENLFEVANGLSRSGEIGYAIGVRFYTNSKYGYGNNANTVSTTAVYFYSFDQSDLRRDATVAYYTYSNSNGDTKEFIQNKNPLSFNFQKWDQRYMSDSFIAQNLAVNGKAGYGINWVIMRYADILLMFAEADNALRGEPSQEAKNALIQVRNRAFKEADRAVKVNDYVNNLNDEQSFFNALVNERAWEFGGEAIRKYDLIRWNLLSAKIEEQRVNFKKMLNKEAPYQNLPAYLFYKYEPNGEIIDKSDINFYVNKGSSNISGYTRVVWLSGLTDDNKTDYKNRIDLFSSGLNATVPNRHLYPIASSVISESGGTIKNAYGFQ